MFPVLSYVQAMEHLQSFIQDCDARTEIAKKRLKETQEELSEEANSKVRTKMACLTKLMMSLK